jgi:2-polyprenyl-3-methyl-5-hydroxy-6-metoxy-1,4-benzoquinol methylase
MKNYTEFYTDGEYLHNNPTWDAADAVWKANHFAQLLKKHNLLNSNTVSEVGCGSGLILLNIAKSFSPDSKFFGYDISPDAVKIANDNKNIFSKELFTNNTFQFSVASTPTEKSDILICADVFEHVENPFEFLRNIKNTVKDGGHVIFNIPLDLSIQSLLRESIILAQRKRVGHINYYTRELALATLHDTGYEIVEEIYAPWYKHYKAESITTKIINVIRNILMKTNPHLCVKLLGGSSLVVLAQ